MELDDIIIFRLSSDSLQYPYKINFRRSALREKRVRRCDIQKQHSPVLELSILAINKSLTVLAPHQKKYMKFKGSWVWEEVVFPRLRFWLSGLYRCS